MSDILHRDHMNITFKSLTESDFPLLLKWLESPHVKAWWDQEIQYNLALVKEKFGLHLHDIAISSNPNTLTYAYIIYLDQNPIGYIQAYNARSVAAAEEDDGLDRTTLPIKSAGIDIFIGETECIGRGLGAWILTAFWQQIVSPHFDACVVDPAKENIRAIHAYKKAGFKIVKNANQNDITWMILKK